jgi:hypothetical protein
MGEGLPGRIEVPVIRAGTVAGGTFAFEDASAQGARTEVLRRASAGGQAVSVSLAPGDLPRLRWARDGRLAAEMVLNQPERVSGPAAAQLNELLGSDPALRERLGGYHHHELLPAGIVLASRLCGMRAEPEAVAGTLRGTARRVTRSRWPAAVLARAGQAPLHGRDGICHHLGVHRPR